MNHALRRDKLSRLLKPNRLDALLVTNSTNVTYLTGFTGDSSYLLLTRKMALVVSDERYTAQLGEECPDLELLIRGPGTRMVDFASQAILSSGAVARGLRSRLGDGLALQ